MWQLRLLLNTVTAGGAACFASLEHDDFLMQGWTNMSHLTYYRLMKEEGSAQFRLWIASNRHDYKKMLHFFNLQNNNKVVKQASSIILDKILVN